MISKSPRNYYPSEYTLAFMGIDFLLSIAIMIVAGILGCFFH
ncbi:MAG TPA: hypothetical protein VHM90_08560 [Phycisphaerae bacterium]|nr:hypothetical protein [Phycisphaerae bacterium]